MRELTNHSVTGDSVNNQITVKVLDGPGSGGACHEYEIATEAIGASGKCLMPLRISFQNGPIKEAGINGITHEALLAIVIDRLRCFQAGPYASTFNASALGYSEMALDALQQRTKNRIARGIEGTHVK